MLSAEERSQSERSSESKHPYLRDKARAPECRKPIGNPAMSAAIQERSYADRVGMLRLRP